MVIFRNGKQWTDVFSPSLRLLLLTTLLCLTLILVFPSLHHHLDRHHYAYANSVYYESGHTIHVKYPSHFGGLQETTSSTFPSLYHQYPHLILISIILFSLHHPPLIIC